MISDKHYKQVDNTERERDNDILSTSKTCFPRTLAADLTALFIWVSAQCDFSLTLK